MILLVPTLLSLLVGVLRGGDLLALAKVHFRHSWLILLGFLIQVLIFSSYAQAIPACAVWTPRIYALSMALLLFAVGLNYPLPGMTLLSMGVFLNALAIWVNDGRMPASLWALQTAGFLPSGSGGASWQVSNSILMHESTRLWFLCDILALPSSWPMANVFSLGDVLRVELQCYFLKA